jgi:hypothetical protein
LMWSSLSYLCVSIELNWIELNWMKYVSLSLYLTHTLNQSISICVFVCMIDRKFGSSVVWWER